jgi:hypothetical protein
MQTLWPVIVGGVIGIAGGLIGPPVLRAVTRRKIRGARYCNFGNTSLVG